MEAQERAEPMVMAREAKQACGTGKRAAPASRAGALWNMASLARLFGIVHEGGETPTMQWAVPTVDEFFSGRMPPLVRTLPVAISASEEEPRPQDHA